MSTVSLCIATYRRSERLALLLEDLTTLVREALSAPAARRKLSCEPEIAADLVVAFTRGLAVVERVDRNPKHLEKMSQAFVRLLVPETKRRR